MRRLLMMCAIVIGLLFAGCAEDYTDDFKKFNEALKYPLAATSWRNGNHELSFGVYNEVEDIYTTMYNDPKILYYEATDDHVYIYKDKQKKTTLYSGRYDEEEMRLISPYWTGVKTYKNNTSTFPF